MFPLVSGQPVYGPEGAACGGGFAGAEVQGLRRDSSRGGVCGCGCGAVGWGSGLRGCL
jgi:hypothetical protein